MENDLNFVSRFIKNASFLQTEGYFDKFIVRESQGGAVVPGTPANGFDSSYGFNGNITSSGQTMYLEWHSDILGFRDGFKVRAYNASFQTIVQAVPGQLKAFFIIF